MIRSHTARSKKHGRLADRTTGAPAALLVDGEGRPPAGDRDLHRPLHLLEGAHLDLTHALARDAELHRQILERDRVVGEPARLEDVPFALAEHSERFAKRLLAVLQLLALGQPRFLVGSLVDEPILPFAGVDVVANRDVERYVTAEAAVHVDHVLLGHAQALRNQLDLVGAQVALFQRRDLALGLAQIEERFFWLAVVPIFTNDHERRMYSWIAALIHHMA